MPNLDKQRGLMLFTWTPNIRQVYLAITYGAIGDIAQTKAMVDNHGMPSVISALESKLSE